MEIKDNLNDFIVRLEDLSNRSFVIADEIRKQFNQSSIGVDYYGRCVSCFVGIKTLLFALNYASYQEKFPEIYFKDCLPSSFPKKNIEIVKRYIAETYMSVRFVLFQNFYSQTEYTYRIIQRKLFPQLIEANPFILISQNFEIMSLDFAKFLNYIRNTIHNNGHFYPKKYVDKFNYNFNNKSFTFEYGKPIHDVSVYDIFDIISFIISENEKLFKLDQIADIISDVKNP